MIARLKALYYGFYGLILSRLSVKATKYSTLLKVKPETKCRLTEKRTGSARLSFQPDLSIGKTTYTLTVQVQKDREFCHIEVRRIWDETTQRQRGTSKSERLYRRL
jgi:hypothetical protein